MTPLDLVRDLSARGVVVALVGSEVKLRGPAEVLTGDDIAVLRQHKAAILDYLRSRSQVARELPSEDPDPGCQFCGSASLKDCNIPPGVRCDHCGRLCDTELVSGKWRCSRCDPGAEARRLHTAKLFRTAEWIRGRR